MIKKLVLASAMAVAPLMSAGPEEATKNRIEIELKNGFKFKKINSPFAKKVLNWTGNLALFGVFFGVSPLGAMGRRLANEFDIELGNEVLRPTFYGSGLSILLAIGIHLASDKLFTDKEELSDAQVKAIALEAFSSEKKAQQDKVA